MQVGMWTERVSFRQAGLVDFEFCSELYFAGRDRSSLDMEALSEDLRGRWVVSEARIITLDGADIGWMQTRNEEEAIFIVQLFIEGLFRGQGIGTEVMHRVIDEGRRLGRAVTLGVVKTNPALRLYSRLGFELMSEDDRKFYMRREP